MENPIRIARRMKSSRRGEEITRACCSADDVCTFPLPTTYCRSISQFGNSEVSKKISALFAPFSRPAETDSYVSCPFVFKDKKDLLKNGPDLDLQVHMDWKAKTQNLHGGLVSTLISETHSAAL